MSYQGGYPQYQGYLLPPDDQSGRRPDEVTAVAILAIVFGAIGALGNGLALLLTTAFREADPALGMLWLLSMWGVFAGFAEIVGGAFALMRWNWARILLTAVFGIGIPVNLYGIVAGYSALTSVISAAIGGLVIAMLWRRDSSAWFSRDDLKIDLSQYPGYAGGQHPRQHNPGQYPGGKP